MSIYNRFKEVRLSLELTQQQMADDLEISKMTLYNYENGRNPLSDLTISKLKNKYSVNPEWLMAGVGDMFLGGSTFQQILKLPYYKEVSASAGHGSFVYDEQTVEQMQIPAKLIKVTHSSNLAVINATGNSMAPLIDNNDFLVVDLNQKELLKEDIYVIRIDDTLMVKRLQKIPKGVIIISENKNYEPIKLVGDDFLTNDVAIIGKVISVIKNFGR